jgi:hypothetical protein
VTSIHFTLTRLFADIFLASFALKIIHECSEAWDKLITVKTPPEKISL